MSRGSWNQKEAIGQGVGLGLPIAEVLGGRWDAGREIWPGIRGGMSGAARARKDGFTIASTWTIDGMVLTHTIACSVAPEPAVVMESLQRARWKAPLFDTHAPSLGNALGPTPAGSLRVALHGKRTLSPPLSAEYSSSRSLVGQIEPHPRAHSSMMKGVLAMRKALTSSVFLDIMTSRMTGYVPRTAATMGANGENISAVLYRLARDEEQKQNLVDWISELCAPPIVDLDFIETGFGDVLFVLVEKDGTRIGPRSASDGTLRFLGELTALRTAEEGRLLLLEEIGNGLHPARVQLLVEILESVTRGGARQVIATTHSPSVLHALSPPALGDAIVFGRHEDQIGSRRKRLADLPHFGEILERRGIEHLFTTKWLERAL